MGDSIGLRELRQQASELVRRVEAGEEILVTVSGRPAARIVPVGRRRWRTGREIASLLVVASDPTWPGQHAERSETLDDAADDLWARPA